MAEDYQGLTPPPELVKQWVSLACEYEGNETWIDLATQAANWGADQELEACCGFIGCKHSVTWSSKLRAARRPKPLSLAEESLDLLDKIQGNKKMWQIEELDVVRRALERLQELENNG